jgi:hypothetical protein
VQGQRVAGRVHRGVHLRALPPLVAVVGGAAAALRGGLQGTAAEDDGGRLGVAPRGEPEDRPEVVDDGLEAAGGEPPAGLLVDRLPRGEVLGEVTPRGATTDRPPRGVEGVAEAVGAPAGVLGEQAEVGDDELPLGVGNVAGVGSVADQTLIDAAYWTKVHNARTIGATRGDARTMRRRDTGGPRRRRHRRAAGRRTPPPSKWPRHSAVGVVASPAGLGLPRRSWPAPAAGAGRDPARSR